MRIKDNRWTLRHLPERLTRGGTRKSGRKDGLRKFAVKDGLVELAERKLVGIFERRPCPAVDTNRILMLIMIRVIQC